MKFFWARMSKEGTLATGHVVKFQQAVDLLPRPRARSNGRVIVGAIALRGEGGEFSSTFSSNWFDGITMVRHDMPACPITVPVNFFRHFSLLLRSCISLVSIPHTVSFAQVANSPFQRHPCTSELQADKDAKATIKQRQAQLVSDRRFTKGAKGEALAQVSAAFHSEREKRCWQNFAFP